MGFKSASRHYQGFPRNITDLKGAGRHTRDGWMRVADHDSVYIDGKQYRTMREWTRPCAVCGNAVQAFEKIDAPEASSRFGNRTCKEHRGLLPAFERGFLAWDPTAKAVIAGPNASGADGTELLRLREKVKVVTDECDNLLIFVKEQAEQIAQLEAELTKYKPPTLNDVMKNVIQKWDFG